MAEAVEKQPDMTNEPETGSGDGNDRSKVAAQAESATESEQPSPNTEAEEAEESIELPPANFETLVTWLGLQARAYLGLIGPSKERPKPNLPMARQMIDLMAVLLEKTKGNLSWEEQRLLENTLTELRFRYVQVADQVTKH